MVTLPRAYASQIVIGADAGAGSSIPAPRAEERMTAPRTPQAKDLPIRPPSIEGTYWPRGLKSLGMVFSLVLSLRPGPGGGMVALPVRGQALLPLAGLELQYVHEAGAGGLEVPVEVAQV